MTSNKESAPVTKLWGVMPAAGVGARMGLDFPKQYLTIAGKTIIEHSIDTMLDLAQLEQLVVCISADDAHFSEFTFDDSRVVSTTGGATRVESVLNGLFALDDLATESDWVLVHDAARPCLEMATVQRLIDSVQHDDIGGILAIKTRDTLKHADSSQSEACVERTLDRSLIWQAQTPQMFRYGVLVDSLRYCLANELEVTDEASALEHSKHTVKLVKGSVVNIKVTTPDDQRLAECLLLSR